MALACLDGVVGDAEETLIPVTDEGLLRGDGVFEVVRLYGGRPFALDDHLARMAARPSGCGCRSTSRRSARDAETLLGVGGAERRAAAARRDARRPAHRDDRAVPDRSEPVKLALVEYAPVRTLDGVKSLSYAANMLATRLAEERGADEALLVTPHGRLLEGPTSSFFYVLGGELCTPPLSDHILDSITRRRAARASLDVARAPGRASTRSRDMSEAFLAGDDARGAAGAARSRAASCPRCPGPHDGRGRRGVPRARRRRELGA